MQGFGQTLIVLSLSRSRQANASSIKHNSLVVIPIGPIVNPEMLSTLKFYCRNVIYRPSGWNSTWLLKVALWAICIISINRQLRWATTGEYGKKINKKISPWNFLSWLPILRWERNVLHVFCILIFTYANEALSR